MALTNGLVLPLPKYFFGSYDIFINSLLVKFTAVLYKVDFHWAKHLKSVSLLWSYHVELWSRIKEGAGLVDWDPSVGQSAGQPWLLLQATGASAERWCSRWAMSGGSPELWCQESHGWGRGREEGKLGWELDGEASSRQLRVESRKYLSRGVSESCRNKQIKQKFPHNWVSHQAVFDR